VPHSEPIRRESNQLIQLLGIVDALKAAPDLLLELLQKPWPKSSMELLSNLVRVSLPNYLAGLPIPQTFGGWFKLGLGDWVSLVPFGATVAGVSYLTYGKLKSLGVAGVKKPIKTVVNLEINKENPKLVDTVDVEDIAGKAVYCRCWRSKKFPLCDGSHNQHNAATGDNVGPLIVCKKSN